MVEMAFAGSSVVQGQHRATVGAGRNVTAMIRGVHELLKKQTLPLMPFRRTDSPLHLNQLHLGMRLPHRRHPVQMCHHRPRRFQYRMNQLVTPHHPHFSPRNQLLVNQRRSRDLHKLKRCSASQQQAWTQKMVSLECSVLKAGMIGCSACDPVPRVNGMLMVSLHLQDDQSPSLAGVEVAELETIMVDTVVRQVKITWRPGPARQRFRTLTVVVFLQPKRPKEEITSEGGQPVDVDQARATRTHQLHASQSKLVIC